MEDDVVDADIAAHHHHREAQDDKNKCVYTFSHTEVKRNSIRRLIDEEYVIHEILIAIIDKHLLILVQLRFCFIVFSFEKHLLKKDEKDEHKTGNAIDWIVDN